MYFVYGLITSILYLIIYIPVRISAANGNKKWQDRLGLNKITKSYDLWLHASSMGKVKVLSYLIKFLQNNKQRPSIYLTVMTDAGYKSALKMNFKNCTVAYFPLDYAPVMKRIIRRVSPKAVVIAETEIWPNFTRETTRIGARQIQVNARMSEKAFGRYKLLKGFISQVLSLYDHFFFKTERDKKYYQYFGVADSKGEIVGDMKFDAPLIPRSEGRIREIHHRAGIDENDFVLVAGSTRSGEEKLIIKGLISSKVTADKKTKLIIAPRHIERVEEIKQICLDEDIAYSIYGYDGHKASIIIVDQMGILNDLYMVADLAFVGGTLVDIGGHNVLEPVWAGTPVVFGSYLSNVTEAVDYIIQNKYGAKILSANELFDIVIKMKTKEVTFAKKDDLDNSNSPTSKVGEYILSRLGNA